MRKARLRALNSSRVRNLSFLCLLPLTAFPAGCRPRPKVLPPSQIEVLEDTISRRWRGIETLKLYGEVTLEREDGIHEGYMELWYLAPWHLRADFTHDRNPLVGMVFYLGDSRRRESWSYHPGQWSLIKTGQPPDPPLQPPHAMHLRKLTGFLRGDATHMAALLAGHLLSTTRFPYSSLHKSGRSFILSGTYHPRLRSRINIWRREPVIGEVGFPQRTENPKRMALREGIISVTYKGYATVEGIPFPTDVIASSSDGWSMHFRHRLIEVNPGIDEGIFRKPKWERPAKMRAKPWEKVFR